MNIWKPTTQPFIIYCQILSENSLRIVRGFDDLNEANQELERLNKPTNSIPYLLKS
jgi:hypothetical protein